jgi:predicted PurR-regulated permease PerM
MSQPNAAPPALLSPAQFRMLAVIAVLLVAGWVLSRLSAAIAPFMAAALLAYACDPLVDKLAAKGVRRNVGSAMVIVFLMLIFVGLALSIVPLVVELSGRIATRLPKLFELLQYEFLPWLKQRFGIALQIDLPHLSAFAQEHARELQAVVARVLGTLSEGGLALINLLVMAVLVPVVLYYLLVDWDRLLGKVDALVPRRWKEPVREIAGEIDEVLGQFLRGQFSVMLILAVFYALALSIAGIDFAVAVGLLTGLLVFIPYIGFSLGLILALACAALQGQGFVPVFAVLGIYGAGQVIEGFVLTPWLVGERIGLHPVAVIFALLAFGQLFGFVGMLLALPAAAAILVTLRAARRSYLESDFYKHA